MVALFPFRYRDPVSGKWVRARYQATREEIAQRHADWELAGAPEVRSGHAEMFRPHYKVVDHAELKQGAARLYAELPAHAAAP